MPFSFFVIRPEITPGEKTKSNSITQKDEKEARKDGKSYANNAI